ncbi:MAG: capsular polysaccharide biosynthesis protein [Flavimaricola sp.]|nr:capsular polysaccharide biosynthesis protein [Flavimaricola sp.]
MSQTIETAAAGGTPRRLFVYNGGFLTQRRIRRMLELSGYDIRLGKPGPEDMVGVWGQSPTSPRGEAVAAHTQTPILRVEDAFLRSVRPGREGEPPIGLHLDTRGVHFDPAQPSDLEVLLATAKLDDTVLLNRARAAIDRLQKSHLSKYSAFLAEAEVPEPGYVLVIDQTNSDASVTASRANRNTFREMLFVAREEHPGARILIKSHPETMQGHRKGHFRAEDLGPNMAFLDTPVSPWRLMEGAVGVYAVSSQLGFEAILAGHRPVLFGQPFYAGWGLSDDRMPLDRRGRKLTAAQLFAAAMILYPTWYDPYRDKLCQLEDAIATLEAETRAWREDHRGWVATGMRLWKRAPIQRVFGQHEKVVFAEPEAAVALADKTGRRIMVWAGKTTEALEAADVVRVEDGFLRSRGLGADLVPPLSLVCDDLGIYYDPSRESRIEQHIAAAYKLSSADRTRTEALIGKLLSLGLSKYNLGGEMPPDLAKGRRILVPGQVEDDASIRLGTSEISTNRGLLTAARTANPAAIILYKPHPDVEAGLRPGAVPDADQIADVVLTATDPVKALDAVEEVWTMTSAIGFEALLRQKKVTCLGQPFYAGWGLTEDRGMPLSRREALPDVVALAHATLIAYPRYFDPVTNRPCPVEVVVERLAKGQIPHPGRVNRALAKVQGVFASRASLWR